MSVFEELQAVSRQLIGAAAPLVVSIGRRARGTGLVIAENRVVTNAHNLRDRTTTVRFAGEAGHDGVHEPGREATALGVDIEGDLALLAVDTGAVTPLPWAETTPSTGDVVFALSAGVRGARISFGLVSSVGGSFRGPRGRLVHGSIEHSAPLARGASGGPLLDHQGRLVGLNTHRLGDGFYLALPAIADLRARLDALGSGDATPTRRLGVALVAAPVARRLRRSVGLDERDGVLVRAVADDSPAARAGVRQGDLIVAANGVAVTTPDDLHAALSGDGAVALSIVRGTDELTVTVSFD